MIEHHYLWKWHQENGDTEGRRKRPSCVVLVVVNERGQDVLFIAPITSSLPTPDRVEIAIPETEAPRERLDTDIALWFMVDELNIDVLEAS